MGKKVQRKSNNTRADSVTETCSVALKLTYLPEDCKKIKLSPTPDATATSNKKEDENPDTKQPHGSPIEILGNKKFYTDEFDAFEKYYDKIHSCNNEHSALHLVNEADQLPFVEYCELSANVEKFPRNDEQNLGAPEPTNTNENIAFAHPSLKIIESADKGRHLITTEKLEKGEIIINEKATVLQINPLCTCLEGDNKMYRCHHCAYALTKFYTCINCNIVVYCSLECLVQSYNEYHRFECEALQRHYWKLDDTDYSYTAFRMMLYGALFNFNHEIPEGSQNKWGDEENNYPYIYRLQTHFDQLPVTKVYEILKEAARIIVYLVVRTNFFKELVCEDQTKLLRYVGGLLVRHYCQAQINCVLLRYPNMDVEYAFNAIGSTGKAICPTIAMLNHACCPNAVIIPCNDRVLVKILKPLPPNTEITIAYQEINPFFGIEERQLLMEYYFYFEKLCQCTLCTHELTWKEYPYKCQICKRGKAKKITLNKEREKLFCKDCKSRSDVDVYSEKTAAVAGNLYRVTFGIDPILRIVESYDKIFPWDSWMLMDAYRILYEKYMGYEGKPLETIKFGLMYFNILEQYLPRLFRPCLEAKLKFLFGVAQSNAFAELEKVTATEFDTIKYFTEECLRTKKDIQFYVPIRYLEFYFIDLLPKLEAVQFNLTILND